MTAKKAAVARRTEADMLWLLRQRYSKAGNGAAGEYAVMFQVRNAAAFNANRTFDAVVMSLWPSRGLTLDAFEVKVSRSDWLRELKDPAKAEAAAILVDRFWMAVADDTIIRDGELPDTWGLLVARGDKLVQVKDAPMLPKPDGTPTRPSDRPVSRSFLVCMLRSAGLVPTASPEEIQLAERRAEERLGAIHQRAVNDYRAQIDKLDKIIRDFEQASGLSLRGYSYGLGVRGKTVAEIGEMVKLAAMGDERAERARQQMAGVHRQLVDAAKALEPFLEPTS